MNRERAHAILDMRLDGISWEEIGKKFGVSKQSVNQQMNRMLNKKANRVNIPFKGLKNAMSEQQLSVKEIAETLGVSTNTALNKLSGERPFKKQEIDRLIEITGADYQTLFGGK